MISRCALVLLFVSLSASFVQAQSFNKVFGGPQDEHATSVVQARDGGYVFSGYTYSYGAGKSDVWVMKVNAQGNEVWRKYFGGSDHDWPNDLIEADDGSLVLAGYTFDRKTKSNKAWIFRLESDGELRWSKTYGGAKGDEAKAIIQTSDGGFAITGFSYSFSRGASDIWVLRLDGRGTELWQKNLGGKGEEHGHDIIETKSGNLIVVGYTRSYGNGKKDLLVMKLDNLGGGVWRKNFGGAENEEANAVLETPEGDIVVTGWTGSQGQGKLDAYILKMDKQGDLKWQLTHGSAGNDVLHDIALTPDKGYVMAGTSTSFGQSGQHEMWMLKLNRDGSDGWQKKSSAPKDDFAYAVASTRDGGYIVAGASESYGQGASDMWILKMNGQGNIEAKPPAQTQDRPPVATNTGTNNTGSTAAVKDDTPNYLKPNMYILTVGISKYNDPSANLTFAHTDASSIADKFATLEGKLFNKVRVKKILNENATLVNIRTGISWLERQATQNDVVLIFFSCHGALDHKGNLYILPTDFNPYNLFATALNIKDITDGMNGVVCKKLVLLDACHSGQSGFDLLEFASAKSADIDGIVKELIDKEPGLTVMTSSSGREYSYENSKWGHGAFTKAILEGLNGRADINGNSVINLSELNYYVTNRVKELTKGRQHPYTPINLFGDIPLFIME